MRTASIDDEKLNKLCDAIRNQTSISIKMRRQLVEDLLKQADVIRQADIERLICIGCSAKLLGMTRAGFHRMAMRKLHVYRLCHKKGRAPKDLGVYFDRREVEELKALRDSLVKN